MGECVVLKLEVLADFVEFSRFEMFYLNFGVMCEIIFTSHIDPFC